MCTLKSNFFFEIMLKKLITGLGWFQRYLQIQVCFCHRNIYKFLSNLNHQIALKWWFWFTRIIIILFHFGGNQNLFLRILGVEIGNEIIRLNGFSIIPLWMDHLENKWLWIDLYRKVNIDAMDLIILFLEYIGLL